MSHAEAVRFVSAVETDTAFGARLVELKDDPDTAFALVRAEGYDCSPDEIRAAFLEAHGAELTAQQLDSIAGGVADWAITGGITAGITTGAALAAAAGFAATT